MPEVRVSPRGSAILVRALAVWVRGAAALAVLLGAAPELAAQTVPWWDPAYGSYRQLTVTAGSTALPAGTLASLQFDHAALVTAGTSQADGDDVRLVYWNGTSYAELGRSLATGSSWNQPTTRITFRTAAPIAASASDSGYYLYYGNAAATAPAGAAPSARFYKVEALAEQSTASSSFVDVPGSTLTFTATDPSEVWLVFVTGVLRSSNTSPVAAEMQLLINGGVHDVWGHQNNQATTPNGAGFLIFDRVTGVTGVQTLQPQFRAAAGTTFVGSLRVVAALLPPGADFQFAETDATLSAAGTSNLLQTLTFTPSSAGDYIILGKVSQREGLDAGRVEMFLEDDTGARHPNNPAGVGYSNARNPWQPATVAFRRSLPASSRTFRLLGDTGGGGDTSDWSYRRIMAFRADAWEALEYSEALSNTTTALASFQLKNFLTTAAPPGPRDYLVIQQARIGGQNSNNRRKAGELRDGGTALLRTNHIINVGDGENGYHHCAAVVNVKRTSASVTYENGFLSPDGTIDVSCAESTIIALRYHEPAVALGGGPPTVTINQAVSQLDPTNGSPIQFTVAFSEPVTGFDASDVTLSGTAGATTAVVTGGPTTYDVAVSGMTSVGTVTVTIGAGAANASTGRPNAPSTSTDNTVLFDNVPPAAPAIAAITDDTGTAGDRVTSDPTLILSGTAEAGTTVTISRSGVGTIGSTVANGSGVWSFDYTGTVLPDGSHTFTATATDPAGNVSSVSADFVVTVDTTPPAAPSITSPASGTSTNFQTLTLSGTAEPASLVRIYDGATLLGSANADGAGAWNFTTPTLSEGTHSFTARAYDPSGNESPPSTAVTVTVDRTAPTVTSVSSPTPDGTYGIGQTVLVTVTFSEPVTVAGGTPQLTLETGDSDAIIPYTAGTGTSTLTFSYTVAPGHQTPDLEYLGATALALAGATLRDAAGNDADLALPAPAAPGSLSANKDIAIADSNPPAAPASLAQFRADGLTALPLGGTTPEAAVVLAARVADPDPLQTLKLQVEVRPTGTPFTGTPTAESELAPPGTFLQVTAAGLSSGSYHWQARTVDALGVAGPWTPFGANGDPSDPDFAISLPTPNAAPSAPALLGQFRSGGIFPIAVGATVSERTVAFKAVLSDPEGSLVRLEIEIQPVGTPFTGSPTAAGPYVPSGSTATTPIAGLADGPYHWQARAIDSAGAASPWVSFGANPETDPDFSVVLGVDLAPAIPSSPGQFHSDGVAAIAVGGTTPEPRIVFKATSSDPESGPWRLEIEVRPVTTLLSGEPTASSPPCPPAPKRPSSSTASPPDPTAGRPAPWTPPETPPHGLPSAPTPTAPPTSPSTLPPTPPPPSPPSLSSVRPAPLSHPAATSTSRPSSSGPPSRPAMPANSPSCASKCAPKGSPSPGSPPPRARGSPPAPPPKFSSKDSPTAWPTTGRPGPKIPRAPLPPPSSSDLPIPISARRPIPLPLRPWMPTSTS